METEGADEQPPLLHVPLEGNYDFIVKPMCVIQGREGLGRERERENLIEKHHLQKE